MTDKNFEWLRLCAANTYSQDGEDGILKAIFAVIGNSNRFCMECGASDGIFFSNTRKLVEQGWSALLIEADAKAYQRLVQNSAPFGDKVQCRHAMIDDTTRLEMVLDSVGAPHDLDLAVIDVDGQDYYLFNSLLKYKPRVVVIEMNPSVDPDFIPALGAQGQAGVMATAKLAFGKLYTPVWQGRWNLILVKQPFDRMLSGPKEHFLGPG